MLEQNMHKDQQKLEKLDKQFEDAKKCEFVISQDLIRYAIGRAGSNIQEAKKIPDILNIKINENSRPPTVQIVGHTEDAVEQARELLEIVRRKIDVPERQMKHLIGVRGETINQIKKDSGVRLIQSKSNYLETIRKGRLRSRRGAVDIAQVERELNMEDEEEVQGFEIADDEQIATLIVVGTSDAVETALVSLNLKLSHLQETEQMSRMSRETKRKLAKYNNQNDYRQRREYNDNGRQGERQNMNDSGRGRGRGNQNARGRGGGRRRERRRNRQPQQNGKRDDSASSPNPSTEENAV